MSRFRGRRETSTNAAADRAIPYASGIISHTPHIPCRMWRLEDRSDILLALVTPLSCGLQIRGTMVVGIIVSLTQDSVRIKEQRHIGTGRMAHRFENMLGIMGWRSMFGFDFKSRCGR
jgi:hypothetical protein